MTSKQDVARLEVTVDNARIMRISEAVKDRPKQTPHLRQGEQFFSFDQVLLEIRPVDPLLKHPQHLSIVQDLRNLNDVGVFQTKLDLGFAHKTRGRSGPLPSG